MYSQDMLREQALDLLNVEVNRITTYDKNSKGNWKVFLVLLSLCARCDMTRAEFHEFDYKDIIFGDKFTRDMLLLFLNRRVAGEYLESIEDEVDCELTSLYDKIICGVQIVKDYGCMEKEVEKEVDILLRDYSDTSPYVVALLIDWCLSLTRSRGSILQEHMYDSFNELLVFMKDNCLKETEGDAGKQSVLKELCDCICSSEYEALIDSCSMEDFLSKLGGV